MKDSLFLLLMFSTVRRFVTHQQTLGIIGESTSLAVLSPDMVPKLGRENRCNADTTEKTLSSPLGNLKISFCEHGLHTLLFGKVVPDDTPFIPQSGTRVRPVDGKDQLVDTKGLVRDVGGITIQWLDTYFNNPGQIASVPEPPICLDCDGASFRGKCLTNLGKIAPFGGTVSYSDLAAAAGNGVASRAAGSAMSTNAIPLIIPCHRVITKSGAMGNYGGGCQVKKFLLEHEAKHLPV